MSNQLNLPFLCEYDLEASSWAYKDWSGDYVTDQFNVEWATKWPLATHSGLFIYKERESIDADKRFLFHSDDLHYDRTYNVDGEQLTLKHHAVTRLSPSHVKMSWKYDYVLMGERLNKDDSYTLAFSFNAYDAPGYNAWTYGVNEHGIRVNVELSEGDFSNPKVCCWTNLGQGKCEKLDHIPDEYKQDFDNKMRSLERFINKCRQLKSQGGDVPVHDPTAQYGYLQWKMIGQKEKSNAV